MRQAGRYLPEYRAIREKTGFLELCRTPDLAAQVTVDTAVRLRVDAAIIFADILLVLDPMGAGLEFARGDGPTIRHPVRTAADVDRLRDPEPGALGYVAEAVRRARGALPPTIPLIGFAGAPFTLASYLIEGGGSRLYARTKAFIATDPGTAGLLEGMRAAGGDVIGLDWRVDLDAAWSRLGHDVAVQGNLDPVALLAPVAEIRRRAAAILGQAAGRPGHIYNLGHGVLPQTPVDHVHALVDAVHELSAR